MAQRTAPNPRRLAPNPERLAHLIENFHTMGLPAARYSEMLRLARRQALANGTPAAQVNDAAWALIKGEG